MDNTKEEHFKLVKMTKKIGLQSYYQSCWVIEECIYDSMCW